MFPHQQLSRPRFSTAVRCRSPLRRHALFGSADRLFVLFGLSYNLLLYVFRIGLWVVPVVLFFVVRRLCRELQQADHIEEIQEAAEAEVEREYAAAPTRSGA